MDCSASTIERPHEWSARPIKRTLRELFGEQSANGGLQLGLSLGFSIATVSIVYFGVQKGIERIARVFLPILFGILVLLLVSALGMDGAGEAIGFIFRPSFGELDGGSVLEALGHAFFTLSLGMGAMVTYGSYLAKTQSIVKASAIIVVLDTLIAQRIASGTGPSTTEPSCGEATSPSALSTSHRDHDPPAVAMVNMPATARPPR